MRLNLSVKAALAAAFGLLALIAVGEGVLSIVKLAGIRRSVTEVATSWIPSVVAVSQLRAAASEVRIKQLRLLSLSDTPSRVAENEARLVATHAKLAEARKAYEPLITSPEERALYDAFVATWTQFEKANAEMRRLMQAGQQAVALRRDERAGHGETLRRSARRAHPRRRIQRERRAPGRRRSHVRGRFRRAGGLRRRGIGIGVRSCGDGLRPDSDRPPDRDDDRRDGSARRRRRCRRSAVPAAPRRDRRDGGRGAGVQGQPDPKPSARSRDRAGAAGGGGAAQGLHAPDGRRFRAGGRGHHRHGVVLGDGIAGHRPDHDRHRDADGEPVHHRRGGGRGSRHERQYGGRGGGRARLVGPGDRPSGRQLGRIGPARRARGRPVRRAGAGN